MRARRKNKAIKPAKGGFGARPKTETPHHHDRPRGKRPRFPPVPATPAPASRRAAWSNRRRRPPL